MTAGDVLRILLAVLLVVFTVYWTVSSVRDLRKLQAMPAWDTWLRAARRLSRPDRFRVYMATLFGRRIEDPQLARFVVQRGEAALAVVEEAREKGTVNHWYRHRVLLALGVLVVPLFLVDTVVQVLRKDWLSAAFALALVAVWVPYWLVVDWTSDLTAKAVERNREDVPDQQGS